MEPAWGGAQETHIALPVESGAGLVFRSQLSNPPDGELLVRVYLLPAVGRTGDARAGQGCGQQFKDIGTARRTSHEHLRDWCAVGFALRLGKHRNAGDRWSAALWLQHRCGSRFLRVSVDRRREFPPRRQHPRKIQCSHPILGSPRGARLRNECGRLWLDECRFPRTPAQPAETNGGAAGAGAEPAAASRELTMLLAGWRLWNRNDQIAQRLDDGKANQCLRSLRFIQDGKSCGLPTGVRTQSGGEKGNGFETDCAQAGKLFGPWYGLGEQRRARYRS